MPDHSAEFDIPGLGKARMAIVALSKEEHGSGNTLINKNIVNELYTEIRAARVHGTSWKKLKDAIRANINVRMSEKALIDIFEEIDARISISSGVAPLNRSRLRKKKQGVRDLDGEKHYLISQSDLQHIRHAADQLAGGMGNKKMWADFLYALANIIEAKEEAPSSANCEEAQSEKHTKSIISGKEAQE